MNDTIPLSQLSLLQKIQVSDLDEKVGHTCVGSMQLPLPLCAPIYSTPLGIHLSGGELFPNPDGEAKGLMPTRDITTCSDVPCGHQVGFRISSVAYYRFFVRPKFPGISSFRPIWLTTTFTPGRPTSSRSSRYFIAEFGVSPYRLTI